MKSYYLKTWGSLLAVALCAPACTVVEKNPDDSDEPEADAAVDDSDTATETETDEDTSDGTATDVTTGEPEPTDGGAPEPETDAGEPTTDTDGGSEEPVADAGEPTDTEDTEDTDGGATTEPPPDTDGGAEPVPGDGEYEQTQPVFGCGDRTVTDALDISGSIDEDQTWSGTVFISDDVSISQAAITIEPGTHIVVGAGVRIELSWNYNPTTFRAIGTEDAPITFCGELDEPGFWAGIEVGEETTSTSRFENVLIENAGSGQPALWLDASVLLNNVVVRGSDSVGVQAVDFDEDSTGLFVSGSAGRGVVLTSDDAVEHFPLGGNLQGNTDEEVLLDFTSIDSDTTFRNLAVPYLMDEASLNTSEDSTTTIEAGTTILFGADSQLEVGWNYTACSLIVEGTADQPVVLRGKEDDKAYWKGILFGSGVRSNTTLNHVEIHGAGSVNGEGALYIDAPISANNLLIDNGDKGVWISAEGLIEGSGDWTITGMDVPLRLDPNALPSAPSGTYTGNEDDVIEVDGDDYQAEGTVPNLGVPYLILDPLDTMDGSNFVVAPGTQFMMAPGSSLEVGWNGSNGAFTAEGTEAEPIRFFGQDPEPGSWEGVYINAGALSSTSLQWVEIVHAGGGAAQAALTLGREVEVTNCTISESATAGIAKDEEDATDYASANTFVDNVGDDVVDIQ